MRDIEGRALSAVAQWRYWTALLAFAAVLGGLVASRSEGAPATPAASVATPITCPAPSRGSTAEQRWVCGKLAGMKLKEEVGQLFEVNGFGQSVRDPDPAMVALNRLYYGVDNIAELIQKFHPGGIIYFSWSNTLTDPAQVVGLSNGIQRVALDERARVPMVISIDQEGGEVTRIGSPATVFPGNMALGATRSTTYAQKAGQISGAELRAMGINVDNAPVVDVNVDPLNQADGVRAYGDEVPLVSDLGSAQVNGYQHHQRTTGVGATAKHWPGFGAAPVNSDTGVAISPQTLGQVKRTNVPPFQAALDAGVDRIMVTHILFPKITGSTIPTSLSSFWINGFLRKRLHYNGPVVTDGLDAAALSSFTPAQVARQALKAGNDELLEIAYPANDKPPGDLLPAYKAVVAAVKNGTISQRRLDQSVIRILDLKYKLGLAKQAITDPSNVDNVVGTPKHLATAKTIAQQSITLLRNSDNLLPLASGSGKKVLLTGFGMDATAALGQAMTAHGLVPTVAPTGSNPTPDKIAGAVTAAGQSDLVVVNTFNAWSSTGQRNLVNALQATGKPVVVAGIGTPYDVAYFPNARTFIANYGYQAVSAQALARVMFGEIQPAGKLPVTITEPPPSTNVLYPFGFNLPLAGP